MERPSALTYRSSHRAPATSSTSSAERGGFVDFFGAERYTPCMIKSTHALLLHSDFGRLFPEAAQRLALAAASTKVRAVEGTGGASDAAPEPPAKRV